MDQTHNVRVIESRCLPKRSPMKPTTSWGVLVGTGVGASARAYLSSDL